MSPTWTLLIGWLDFSSWSYHPRPNPPGYGLANVCSRAIKKKKKKKKKSPISETTSLESWGLRDMCIPWEGKEVLVVYEIMVWIDPEPPTNHHCVRDNSQNAPSSLFSPIKYTRISYTCQSVVTPGLPKYRTGSNLWSSKS